MSNSLSGQDPVVVLDSITAKFTRYCQLFPREEIYVHTDREEYIAGENIWFKLYLFDGQAGRLSSTGSIVYFEILNSDFSPVVQLRIKLDGGLGSGMAVLPDTLSSERYTLRAYTNRMKNFMPGNCFSKGINVYNALNPGTFRDVAGQNQGFRGPVAAESLSGKEESELSFAINNRNSEALEIIITAGSSLSSAGSNMYCLFIHNHGNINFRKVVSLTTGKATVSFPEDGLTPGINHITLFSSAGEPLDEGNVLIPPVENHVIGLSDPGSIGIREKVILEFQLSSREILSGEAGDLSISVSPSGGDPAPGIAEYLLFDYESGEIPDTMGMTGITNVSRAATGKLMNAGSNWTDWNTILSGNYPDLIYEAEKERHFIHGQLLDRSGQGSGKGRYMFLSIPGKNAVFQYSLSDEDGRFVFSLPIDEGISDLIIQPENPGPDDVIRMEPAFSGRSPVSVRLPFSAAGASDSHITKWGVNYQLRRIFKADSVLPPRMPVLQVRKVKRFYGKPETELLLKDYIDLPVMEEVFYELLDGIQLRNRKTSYEITMTDPVYSKPYEKPPVMFIDGVVVNDPSVIAGLEPDKAEKIDVIRSRYVVGDYLFFGLVNIITKTGDFSSVVLPDYAVRLPYRIFDPVPEFWSPSYPDPAGRQSRIPDLRNTLYWNPSVKPDREGRFRVEFWSSDYVTDYEINIQGIDSSGEPVSFRTILKAKE